MTGLHGVHVLVGIGVLSVMLVRVVRGTITPQNPTYLVNSGLYWHLVDIIWIFLFPLFISLPRGGRERRRIAGNAGRTAPWAGDTFLCGGVGALIALTATTVAVAGFNLQKIAIIVCLAIAAVKSTLVLFYFMHLGTNTGSSSSC